MLNKYAALILFPLPGLILSILCGVFGWVLFPNILHSEIVKQVRLVEGSETWNKWKEAPIPIYLSFYIQHVTNPDEVESGLTPVFLEKGPYTYRQKRVKVDISQESPNTVKYKEVKTYFFEQSKSGDNSEEDLVNIPNIPFVGVVHTIKKMLPIDLVVGLVGNIILSEEPLIKRNVPVKEVLFQGFDVTKYTTSLLGRMLPEAFSGGRFGLYKGKNGTASEQFEVYTGLDNSQDFGRIKTYAGKEYLGFWQKFSPCDKPTGTDGSIFHPFLTKNSVLDAFSSDVCRSLPVVYSEDIEFKGIPGYRFRPKEDSFESARTNEANRCYCLEEDLEKCPYTGVLSLEACTKAPIWTSGPHFLGSDIRYLVDSGMAAPEKDKHGTFIDIEPTTGFILRAHKRLQVSLEIEHNRKVRSLQRLTKNKMLFPLLWADESAELNDALIDDLKGKLITPQQIVGVVKWIVLVIGILLFLAGLAFAVNKYFLNGVASSKKVGLDLTRPSTNSSGAEGKGIEERRRRSVNRNNLTSSSSEGSVSYIF